MHNHKADCADFSMFYKDLRVNRGEGMDEQIDGASAFMYIIKMVHNSVNEPVQPPLNQVIFLYLTQTLANILQHHNDIDKKCLE